uniref:Uncharacterized protein n=1 Tax=Periophthalmus magnuspinnatus TaxID=409849 RepID=A0A3B4A4C9_9GOBI
PLSLPLFLTPCLSLSLSLTLSYLPLTSLSLSLLLSFSSSPLYTFKDHLEQQRFSEASQLLIDEENELFLQTNESVQLLNSATDELQNSHQKLEEAILKTIRLSLNRGEVSPEVLRSAVTAMCKETDQDLFWIQQRQDEKPKWRPSSLQNEHDKVLNFLVDERMDNPTAPCCSPETVQGSSIQTDVWGMGRQVKQDLETVVEVIRTCYPKNMDICNIYAKLFHNALGTRLQKIAEFGLDDKDCTFILRWVNEFYPQNVLVGKSFLFPDEVRAQCLSILKEMHESAQSYLLTPVHAQLKSRQHKRSSLGHNITFCEFKCDKFALGCVQELMGRFHLEVSVEYVKRLIRGEKLKDTKKQQEVHNSIQRDAGQLHQLFCKMGSQEEWLKDVLIRIAELLKLQDLVAVQMHVATMGTSYPDISEKHVSAILKLKSNFTKTNRQTVKETLRDILNESATTTTTTTAENTQIFFSLLPV